MGGAGGGVGVSQSTNVTDGGQNVMMTQGPIHGAGGMVCCSFVGRLASTAAAISMIEMQSFFVIIVRQYTKSG